MRIASVGHAVFAATMVALGILGFVTADFAPIWQSVPKNLPVREALAFLTSFLSLASGISLYFRRSATIAARILLASFVLWMVIFKMRFIVLAPLTEGSYQSNGENAVLVAGAWVLYVWFAESWDKRRLRFATGDSGLRIARVLYALAMIAFGLSHFAYVELTAPIIPDWIPWHLFWAYFTGCAYLAAGAAILFNVYARLAAVLSALQMAVFTFVVWVPMMVSGHITVFQWSEFVVSWTLTAAAWVVADSYRQHRAI